MISKNARNLLKDMHVYKGVARGTRGHYLLESILNVAERWRARQGGRANKCINVNELLKGEKVGVAIIIIIITDVWESDLGTALRGN